MGGVDPYYMQEGREVVRKFNKITNNDDFYLGYYFGAIKMYEGVTGKRYGDDKAACDFYENKLKEIIPEDK